ncbi:hypothetical protein TSO352_30670 [Azospirillum sp. TSO35-2]|nr:hypothetical protein TSO352_30670 [Azospirillum sp. TSO35-2]
MAVGFGGGLCGVPGQPNVAWAAGDPVAGMRTGTLVVVFLRGGADTLSLMAPADDPDYRAARAPELRVQTDGEAAGLPLAQTLAAGIDFRLHPEAAPLAELYRDRSLAIVHAAGLTDGTRSHFVAQDLIERGVGDEAALTRTGAGWAARWLGDGAADGMAGDRMTLSAMAAGTGVPAALAGHGGTLAVGDLDRGLAPPGGKATAAVLDGLFRGDDGPYARAGRDALAGLAGIDARLPRGADGKIAPYAAEGGAAYETGEAARGLQTVARLVKMEIGLRLAWVDVGGWDTHENQPGRFANAVRGLSRALAAFHADTNRFHDRVTLVVLSEFGRRLRSNRSQGTDHGHGGAMLALGGRVAGGRMLGRWPGLASHQLDRGVDLAVTTDYRAVLAGLVGPAVFPGYAGPGLGLLTA